MINIKKSSTDNTLIVDYSSSSLAQNRRKLMMFRGVCKGSDSKNGTLIIPYTNLTESLAVVNKAMTQLKITDELSLAEEIQSAAVVAKQNDDSFRRFSERARAIRNDEHAKDDIEGFTKGLLGFQRTLHPFQLLAAYHLAFAQNAGNFSVPGAGKTSTVLAAYWYLHETNDHSKKVGALVVISPLAAFKAWKDEFKECFQYEPSILEVYGKSDLSKKAIKSVLLSGTHHYDIVLVGYQSLLSYEEELGHYIDDNQAMVVLDEAHRIKKVGGGQWSDSALRLAPRAKSRVVLTGTPAPNGYVDLKNLFDFMWPKDNVIGYSTAQLRDMTQNEDHARSEDLSNRISPFFIRVNKQHLNLPDAIFNDPIMIEMDNQQRKIYEGIAKLILPKSSHSSNSQGGGFRAKLIRLRQAASNPSLVLQSLEDYNEDCAYEDYLGKDFDDVKIGGDLASVAREYSQHNIPPKFSASLKLATKLVDRNEKLIIWCEFVNNIRSLGAYLESNGIGVEYLYGGIEKADRDQIIDDFHKYDSTFKVIIANPHAVGESISLHKACHNALYFEMSFNAASYMQSKDRIHRLGLSEDIETNYYFLLSKNTIDETIYERVFAKEKRMLELLDSREIPLLVNNRDFLEETSEDIKAVIRDYYHQRGTI